MNVFYKPSAIRSIEALNTHLAEVVLMPETGIKYAKKMLVFGSSLSETYNAYNTCKFPKWKKRKLNCATFDNTWVFAFKIVKSNVVIYHIVNGKMLKY